MSANYADSNSQLYISFYYGGYNYSAIVGTAGTVTVQSPTATAGEVHNLIAAYYVALLKETLIDPNSISINRVKAGMKVVDGRTVPVCELDITLKNSLGNSVRAYYLARQYGRPSNLTTLYDSTVGYLWRDSAITAEDNDIIVSQMLDPNVVMSKANELYAVRNYQLFNK